MVNLWVLVGVASCHHMWQSLLGCVAVAQVSVSGRLSLARSLRGLTYSTLKFMRSTCGKSMCQVALHVLNIKMFCTLEISDDLSRKSDSNIKWHWKTLVNSPEQYCCCVGMEEAWIVWVGEGHTITVCVGWTVDTVSSLHFGSVKKSSEKLLDNDHKNVNQNSWIPNQV